MMNQNTIRSAGLLLGLTAASCESPGAIPADGHFDLLPVVQATEERRIGSVADAMSGFSRIASVDVDAEGFVYVADADARSVKVFSPQGVLTREIGGHGSGPGEFQYISAAGIVGDTLWVTDIASSRITFFDRRGSVLGSTYVEPIPLEGLPTGIAGRLQAAVVRDDGLILSTPVTTMHSSVFMSTEGPASYNYPEVLFDANGTIVDTLRIATAALPRPAQDPVLIDGHPIRVPKPLGSEPVVIIAGSGWWEVEREAPTSSEEAVVLVSRQSMDGVQLQRRIAYKPESNDSVDMRRLIEPVVHGLRDAPFLAENATRLSRVRDALSSAVELPPFQQPVYDGRLGDDGTLWLTWGFESDFAEELLLDEAGMPLGVVHVPDDSTLYWSDGSIAWGVEVDELGLQWLVLYRIPAFPPAS